MPRAAVKERPTRSDKNTEESTCQHHWYIATPAGSTSKGFCRRCGEERDFRNSTTDYVWDDDSRSGGSPWRGSRPSKTTVDDPDQISSAATGSKAVVS